MSAMFPTEDIESRGAWLFRHMLTLYGSRFLAMWRGVDTEDLKRAWSLRLRDLSPEALCAGLRALEGVAHPPTLPEFLALCRETRVQQVAVGGQRPRALAAPCSPEVADANLSRMAAIVRSRPASRRRNGPLTFSTISRQSLVTHRAQTRYAMHSTRSARRLGARISRRRTTMSAGAGASRSKPSAAIW